MEWSAAESTPGDYTPIVFFTLARVKRPLADAPARGVCDRISDRDRSLAGLACAEERLSRPVDDMDLDVLEEFGEAQDRVWDARGASDKDHLCHG